jgi:heme-degrading monooxygenase HmoA
MRKKGTIMYIVTFETWPNEIYRDQYLIHAQAMTDEVEKIKGFVSVERFQSLTDDGKLLSMSVWESMDAINEWRSQAEHQLAQEMGKNKYFNAYHIRVAKVEREYG